MYWLYNRNGQAELFIYDNDRFISKNGRNLGWLYNGNVYGIRDGHHLGWFEDGILYDNRNCIIAFSRDACGYLPSRPTMGGILGTPGIPGRPEKPGFGGVPGRPSRGVWSSLPIDCFFENGL